MEAWRRPMEASREAAAEREEAARVAAAREEETIAERRRRKEKARLAKFETTRVRTQNDRVRLFRKTRPSQGTDARRPLDPPPCETP